MTPKHQLFYEKIQKLNKKIQTHSLPSLISKGFGKVKGTYSRFNIFLRKAFPETIENYQLSFHRKASYVKTPSQHDKPRLNILLPSLKEKAIFGGALTAAMLGFITRYRYPPCSLRFLISEDYSSFSTIHHKLRQSLPEDICTIPYEMGDLSNSALQPVHIHSKEVFLTTFWNTCYLLPENTSSFYYLIQDYEPGFYPWGDEYVAAQATYNMNCTPIFNTGLLRDYFIAKEVISPQQIEKAMTFEPALHKNLLKLTRKPKRSNEKKVLFFYGRPGTPRNLFLTGINALSQAINQGLLKPEEWNFISAGEPHPDIVLGKKATLKSVGKLTLDQYYSFLETVDIGLSLMVSPHPSYPPVELASLGIPCITNSFANKNLSALHPSILTCEASTQGILDALKTASEKLPITNINISKPAIETDWVASLQKIADKIAESFE